MIDRQSKIHIYLVSIFALLFSTTFFFAESLVEQNPLLLKQFYSRSTISFPSFGKVDIIRIDYTDIDNKIVKIGDSDIGYSRIERLSFKENKIVDVSVFKKKDSIEKIESKESFSYYQNKIEIQDLLGYIENYSSAPGIFTSTKKSGGGLYGGVVKFGEGFVKCWDLVPLYSRRPDLGDIELNTSGQISVIIQRNIDGTILAKWVYITGILMSIEYKDGKKYSFSTVSGQGKVELSDSSGNITEVWNLERKIDSNGFLRYERCRYQNGSGYELFIQQAD